MRLSLITVLLFPLIAADFSDIESLDEEDHAMRSTTCSTQPAMAPDAATEKKEKTACRATALVKKEQLINFLVLSKLSLMPLSKQPWPKSDEVMLSLVELGTAMLQHLRLLELLF